MARASSFLSITMQNPCYAFRFFLKTGNFYRGELMRLVSYCIMNIPGFTAFVEYCGSIHSRLN